MRNLPIKDPLPLQSQEEEFKPKNTKAGLYIVLIVTFLVILIAIFFNFIPIFSDNTPQSSNPSVVEEKTDISPLDTTDQIFNNIEEALNYLE